MNNKIGVYCLIILGVSTASILLYEMIGEASKVLPFFRWFSDMVLIIKIVEGNLIAPKHNGGNDAPSQATSQLTKSNDIPEECHADVAPNDVETENPDEQDRRK